jgi:hypothetical protein
VYILSRVRGINTSFAATLIYKQFSAIADLHNLHFIVTQSLGFPVLTGRILATELNSLTATASSNHKLSLHRLTSNSYSTTNFSWLPPTDNWLTSDFNSHSRSTTDSFYTSVLLLPLTSEFDCRTLDMDHATHKKQPLYCCRGVLPRSCIAISDWTAQKTPSSLVSYCDSCMFIGSLPSNGCPIVESLTSGTFLPRRCVAVGRWVTMLLTSVTWILKGTDRRTRANEAR